jgi:hypothetical protein
VTSRVELEMVILLDEVDLEEDVETITGVNGLLAVGAGHPEGMTLLEW